MKDRIIDILTVLILVTAATFIGYTIYAAGDTIRRQLVDMTIPIRLNFERMGAESGNASVGNASEPVPLWFAPRPGTETRQLHFAKTAWWDTPATPTTWGAWDTGSVVSLIRQLAVEDALSAASRDGELEAPSNGAETVVSSNLTLSSSPGCLQRGSPLSWSLLGLAGCCLPRH